MKIYTRTGDDGGTSLFGGGRVKKNHARVAAYGAVDEANAAVGLVHTAPDLPAELGPALLLVMSDLFDAGAELATPADNAATLRRHLDSRIDQARIDALEAAIDGVDARVPPLKTFVLPTGGESCARLHLARTAVRRAERAMVDLVDVEGDGAVRPLLLAFVNRLSDTLFAWSRLAAHGNGHGDIPWIGKKT